MNPLATLSGVLPDRWPRIGKGIKLEDDLAQVELDLFLGRMTRDTGSAPALHALRVEGDGRSLNQKRSAATCLLMRDGDPEPLIAILQDEFGPGWKRRARGLCYPEQFSRYQPRFHARDNFVALLYLVSLPAPTERQRRLEKLLRLWLSGHRWCLDRFAVGSKVCWIGTRRSGPMDDLDEWQLAIWRGNVPDLERNHAFRRDMGLEGKGGSTMNGGMPRGTGEYFALELARRGILQEIKPSPPPLAIDHDARWFDDGDFMAWFPRLAWRPGDGPIVLAVHYQPERKRPRAWICPDRHTAVPSPEERGDDVWLPVDFPTEAWGFNPVSMEAYR